MSRWEELADLVDEQDTSEMIDRGELTEVDVKVSVKLVKVNSAEDNPKYIACSDVNHLPLYLIERKEDGTGWVDEAYGYVVRAISSRAARKLAAENRGGDEPEDVWLNPDKSTCTRITASGKIGILLAAIRGN